MSRRLRVLADLTPAMSRALVRCYAAVIQVDSDHGIHPATITALRRHGLIEEARDKRARRVWKPTAQGMHIIGTQEPRLLEARSQRGYTTEPAQALPDEPEAIEAAVLEYFTADAHERFTGLPGRREEALRRRARSLANRLRQEAVAGLRAGLDVSAELDHLEQHLALLERRRTAA